MYTEIIDAAYPKLRRFQKLARELAIVPPNLAAMARLARPERIIRVIEGDKHE